MAKKRNMQNNKTSAERDLTPKQDLFCLEYLKDYNATQAAIRAKYSPKTAYKIGSENLRKPQIIKRIDFYKKQSMVNAEVKIQGIVNELKALGYSDLTDVFKTNKEYVTLAELKELPPHVRRSIKSFEYTKDGIKIKFHSKEKALELLGKYKSMFSENINLGGQAKDDNELIIKVIQVNGAGPPPKAKKK